MEGKLVEQLEDKLTEDMEADEEGKEKVKNKMENLAMTKAQDDVLMQEYGMVAKKLSWTSQPNQQM